MKFEIAAHDYSYHKSLKTVERSNGENRDNNDKGNTTTTSNNSKHIPP